VSIDRRDLHALLDRVPEGDLPVIRKLLPAVRDIEAAEAYFDKGGSGISHEEILREFGLG
jgi:hypothetical protein